MKLTILEDCRFEIKAPAECSERELVEFHDLVLLGRKVPEKGLLNRVKKCELLAFCYYSDTLVGVSSVKHPSENYRKSVINKAQLDMAWQELDFEIGYSCTSPDVRRNGISQELKKRLLESMKSHKGKIFSTTAIKSSQSFLEQNGFAKSGNPYDGDNDKGIIFYVKTI